jgi:hypothetical protein
MKIFDFETQRWSVVQRTCECDFPTWSSDSQFIYFLPRDDLACFESAYRVAMRSALLI